ncbi:phosphatase PAP2 family protein [Ilumatobacter nonamiensis]|uniref:phosphatase PAP2 family protein n=1 Tax=Ilumatobacter nonamiensis TaxID=467093 RepID=UPI00034A53E8|nr:phosphatase PAP2 family protein [Ilumatobacter nonamiensis]
MSTLLAVLLAGLVGAAVLIGIAAVRGRPAHLDDPVDAERTDHWLVERVARHPRLHRLLVHADRRVVGGVAVAVCFGVILVAGLFIGWVFDTVDTDSGFARWDQSVADWGPEHATDGVASFMKVVTDLGGTSVLLALMTVIGLIDWRRRKDATSLWFLLTVGIGVVIVNNALKLWIDRQRPPVDHLVTAAGSSFPSGHSAASAACWMAIALVVGRGFPPRVRPWLFALAAAIACLVASSRTLLGVHWVTDVVAGLTVGWAWFFVVAVIFGGRLQRFGEPVDELAATPVANESELNGARNGS